MIRVVSVDVHGLDLVLGGGVPVLRRYPEYEESATLLLRGPPGSGKTVFGTQLAGAMARLLNEKTMFDVVYGCVELLPTELAAQHAGLKPTQLPERVVVPPFAENSAGMQGKDCRIYAGLLNLTAGEEQAEIEDAIESLLNKAIVAGAKPRVLVIDSLSDGYNLGSAAPRLLADAICKIAVEKGLILILLEETIDGKPSAWSFAVDIVMELRQRSELGGDRERSINIVKNRFGPVEPGPHRVNILNQRRIVIRPEPSTYISSTTKPRFVEKIRRPSSPRRWGIDWFHKGAKSNGWPLLTNQTIAICGPYPTLARQQAQNIGGELGANEAELVVELHQLSENAKNVVLPNSHAVEANRRLVLGLGYPYLGGDRLIDRVTGALLDLARQYTVARVIVGDTRSLRLFASPDEMLQSLMVLATLSREAGIPLILFDGSEFIYDAAADRNLPPIVDFADVTLVGRMAGARTAPIIWEGTYGANDPFLVKEGSNSKLVQV